jgi:lipoprotein NlpI
VSVAGLARRAVVRLRAAPLLASIAAVLLCLDPCGTQAAATPLLDYARELSFPTQLDERAHRQRLARVSYTLEHDPPPAADCARTLGAERFAGLLMQLADARSELGDADAAAEGYRRALECSPRAPYLHAGLAQALFSAGRYQAARNAVLRGLALERNHRDLGLTLARLDLVDERFQEAIVWLQWVTRSEPDERRATYYECLLWLAQRRAGELHPQLIDRMLTDEWPRPLLEALQGRGNEATMLARIRDMESERVRREALAEALYYVGEQRLADGQRELARRYFAATVNLKVLDFIEHQMALAELDRIRP